MKDIPLYSWDGKENLVSDYHLNQLEKHLPPGIVFNTIQSAVSACLEILGSKYNPISVVLPVNITPDILAGVIQAGGRPVILDVDSNTFQIDTEQLKEALKELKDAVVCLTRPAGIPAPESLLETVQDVPTIGITNIPPVESNMRFTFNLYDLSLLCGEGAVVFQQDETQQKDLKIIQKNNDSGLSEVNSALVYKRLPLLLDYPTGEEYLKIIETFEKSDIIGYGSGTPNPVFLLQVKDVQPILGVLRTKGLLCSLGCIPVYKYEIAKKRWATEPNYPVAERLFKTLLLLPNHDGVNKRELLELIATLSKVG